MLKFNSDMKEKLLEPETSSEFRLSHPSQSTQDGRSKAQHTCSSEVSSNQSHYLQFSDPYEVESSVVEKALIPETLESTDQLHTIHELGDGL